MKKFTLKEIRIYMLSQETMSDVFYNLNEKNVELANLELANDRLKLIEDLMKIREDWTKKDFYEAYEDWSDIDELSLEQMKERMEVTVTHTYSTSHLFELIKDEK